VHNRVSFGCFGRVSCGLVLLFACVTLPTYAATNYVDASLGNNGYDGLSNVITNGHGPKLNIASAISASSNGDVIVVETGFYQETEWDPGTNSLTLLPQGQVTVYQSDTWHTYSIGDGISDGWRQYYFGSSTTTNSDSCASCTPGGDPLTNLQEYQASTNHPSFTITYPNNGATIYP